MERETETVSIIVPDVGSCGPCRHGHSVITRNSRASKVGQNRS
jgi:hypothetical protein